MDQLYSSKVYMHCIVPHYKVQFLSECNFAAQLLPACRTAVSECLFSNSLKCTDFLEVDNLLSCTALPLILVVAEMVQDKYFSTLHYEVMVYC